jgi:hypothetical protein
LSAALPAVVPPWGVGLIHLGRHNLAAFAPGTLMTAGDGAKTAGVIGKTNQEWIWGGDKVDKSGVLRNTWPNLLDRIYLPN